MIWLFQVLRLFGQKSMWGLKQTDRYKMWSRFNLFQLSRERWLWHKFYKLLCILLLPPINFFYGTQRRDFHDCHILHTHRALPMLVFIFRQVSGTQRSPKRWHNANQCPLYPVLDIFETEGDSGRSRGWTWISYGLSLWVKNICLLSFALRTWEVVWNNSRLTFLNMKLV